MRDASKSIEARKAMENFRGTALSIGGQAQHRIDQLTGSGVASYDGGNIVLKDSNALAKMGKGVLVTQQLLAATALEARAGNIAQFGGSDPIQMEQARQLMGQAASIRAGAGDSLAGMSVEDKRKYAQSLMQAGLSDEARGVASAAAAQDRLGKLNRKRGSDSAVSQFLGVELDSLTKGAMKGASIDEKARIIAEAAGLHGGAGQEDIKAALGALGKGGAGAGKASQILSGLAATPGFQEAMKEKSLQKAKDENPLQDAMNKNLDKIVDNAKKQTDFLKLISRHTGATADEIGRLDRSDPENPTGKTKKVES